MCGASLYGVADGKKEQPAAFARLFGRATAYTLASFFACECESTEGTRSRKRRRRRRRGRVGSSVGSTKSN